MREPYVNKHSPLTAAHVGLLSYVNPSHPAFPWSAACQVPAFYDAVDPSKTSNKIVTMLSQWAALPFSLELLREGRGLIPFAPMLSRDPALTRTFRDDDSKLMVSVFETVHEVMIPHSCLR